MNVRFVTAESVVHSAFVRVLPGTVTTVSSLRTPDFVELAGTTSTGIELAPGMYFFGVDFTDSSPAEYVIREPGDPTGEPPGSPDPATAFTLLVPDREIAVSIGAVVEVAWTDEISSPDATITIYLRPVNSQSAADLILWADSIAAALDGSQDHAALLVRDVPAGRYFVLAAMMDGGQTVWSAGPGILNVRHDPANAAPTLAVTSPAHPVSIQAGDVLHVAWNDRDPDSNATIRFTLQSSDPAGPRSVNIGRVYREDPDGPGDIAAIQVSGALPGLYDLVATITDGELTGSHRLKQVVRILPEPANEAPSLEMLEPSIDLELDRGGSFHALWRDFDENDDATISLLLDPDLGAGLLDGDEYVLVSGLSEDQDELGDQLQIIVPMDVSTGVYRLRGMITDGPTEVIATAPGLLYIGRGAVEPGDDGGGDGGGSGGPGGDPGSDPGDGGSGGDILVLNPDGLLAVSAGRQVELRIALPAAIANDPTRRFFLTNLTHGGAIHVDISRNARSGRDGTVIQIPPDTVPNDAWPRVFDVIIETTTDAGSLGMTTSRPIWVRQEVGVVEGRMADPPCRQAALAAYAEYEVHWYGGGFSEEETPRPLQLWLSADGRVPENMSSDSTHQLVYSGPGSPNRVQVLRLTETPESLPAGFGYAVEIRGILPGSYELLAVLDPTGPEYSVTSPMNARLTVCGED